jgi:ribonuclease P protein component
LAAFFAGAFFAAFFGAAAFAAVPRPVDFRFFFFGLETPVEPMWILPRLDRLSPFPIDGLIWFSVKVKIYIYESKTAAALLQPSHFKSFSIIRATFNKEEILRSKKRIDLLFKKGRPVSRYPVKMMHLRIQESSAFSAQAMFVVPKRAFKKAHDRNRLRRRMKEAYRQQKHVIEQVNEQTSVLLLAFIFTGTKDESYQTITDSVGRHLGVLLKKNG